MPEFLCPRIFYGEDAVDYINKVPGNKAFIVTDKGIVKVGVLKLLTDKLEEFGKEFQVFDEVEPDPHEQTIIKGAGLCNKYKPDIIIGLGGGSSLDAAKGIWFLYEHAEDGKTIDDLNPFETLHMGRKAKCIGVATTSGTGAETTWAVIVTRIDDQGRHSKLEQAHTDVVPTYALIDPRFTKGLPPNLTGATAFDAIAHAGEALVSGWRNEMSYALAVQSLFIMKDWLPKVMANGSDNEARAKVGIAATMAGLAFGNSQVIIGHAMGHSLGAVFHITHGLTVGVMLPYVIEYCIQEKGDPAAMGILATAAKQLGLCEWNTEEKAACQKFIGFIRELQKVAKMPTTLKELGITLEKLNENMDRLVELANESASAAMTPRDVSNEDVKNLLLYALEGKSVDF